MILILLFYDSQCDKADKSPPQSNVTLDKGDENDMVEIAPHIEYTGPGKTKWHGTGSHGKICHADNCKQGSNWAACECRWDECCSIASHESRCTKCVHIAEIRCTDSSECGTSANGEPQCCEQRRTNSEIMYEKICGPCTSNPICRADRDCPGNQGCCMEDNAGVGKCGICEKTGACEADHDCAGAGKCCKNKQCVPCECLPGYDKTCRGNCGSNGRDCQSVAECQGGLCCLYMTFPKNELVARDEYSFKDKLQCGSCSEGHCMDDCGCREGLYCSEAKRCEPRGPRLCSRRQVGILLMGSPYKIRTQNYDVNVHVHIRKQPEQMPFS